MTKELIVISEEELIELSKKLMTIAESMIDEYNSYDPREFNVDGFADKIFDIAYKLDDDGIYLSDMLLDIVQKAKDGVEDYVDDFMNDIDSLYTI